MPDADGLKRGTIVDSDRAEGASTFDHFVDVLVVGSGAGGLTAALVAAANHADALVVEKSDLYGGTSATSGGGIWIPNSHLARAAGQEDTAEEAFRYVRELTAPNVTDEQIWAFVRGAPEMLAWLEANSDVRYMSVPYTDYHAELPGGKLGWRTHMAMDMDGRLLGDDVNRMRTASPAASLFGRINWGLADTHTLLFRGKGWLTSLLRILARYYLDVGQRLKTTRDRHLTLGTALIGMLKLSLNKRGVPLWLNTRLVELLRDGDRIVGAVVEKEGKRLRIRAEKGVVLAGGGFERNAEMRGRYLPGSADPLNSGSQINNTGDTIAAALAAGAATRNMDSAWWAPMFRVPGEDRGRMCTFERALPGSFIVNQAGERYQNEAASYHIFGRGMIDADRPEARTTPSWILFDAGYRARYPMGPVLPLVPDWMLPAAVRSVLVRADSWDELARKINIPPAKLNATVERFNSNARKGEDPDFGRGHQAYDRYYGDPRVEPNPNLAPLDKAPFYALPLHAGDIGTNGGIVTDGNGQVLDDEGRPLPGLYAVGNNAGSVMGYSYPGAGATLGPAMTFAYLAARHMTGANA